MIENTHQRGSRSVAELLADVPTLSSMATDTVKCEHAEIVQMIFEIRSKSGLTLLPPSLHPSVPAHATAYALKINDGPAGAFVAAMVRVGCRAGLSARAFVRRVYVSTDEGARFLRERYGYDAVRGDVEFVRRYDRIVLRVVVDGQVVLDSAIERPQAIPISVLRLVTNLTTVHAPQGPRIVQVEERFNAEDAQRGKPVLTSFSDSAWGLKGLVFADSVGATYALGSCDFGPTRYVVGVEELAESSTERIA